MAMGFFDHDVCACVGGGDGCRGVEAVGGADEDDVGFGLPEHLFVVGVEDVVWEFVFFSAGEHGVHVDIGERGDLDFIDAFKGFVVDVGDAAGSDESGFELFGLFRRHCYSSLRLKQGVV